MGAVANGVHYAASKAAIDTMTVGLAREVADEWHPRQRRSAPGLIETELHAANGSADRLARLAPAIPMKRASSADKVAESVLWLLSPGSSYVTGAIILGRRAADNPAIATLLRRGRLWSRCRAADDPATQPYFAAAGCDPGVEAADNPGNVTLLAPRPVAVTKPSFERPPAWGVDITSATAS